MEQAAHQCNLTNDPLDWLTLTGMVRVWWAQLSRSTGIPVLSDTPTIRPSLSQALRYMRANMQNPVTVEAVAAHVHLSSGYLRELFRKELNSSFSQTLREMRMAQAKILLLYSQFTITEIATREGYSDVHHFSHAFSKAESVPPSVYRESSRRGM